MSVPFTKENEEVWLYTESGRTEVFEKWLESLEKDSWRRKQRIPPEKKKLSYRNYATP